MTDAPDLFVTGGDVVDGNPVAAALDSGLPGASVLINNPAAGFALCLNASEIAAITGVTPDANVKEKLYWVPAGPSYMPVALLTHGAVIAHGIEIGVDFCAGAGTLEVSATILAAGISSVQASAGAGAHV